MRTLRAPGRKGTDRLLSLTQQHAFGQRRVRTIMRARNCRPSDVLLAKGPPRWRAERLSPFFEFLDECSEMRRGGGREGVVLVLKAFPNC
jgi:hypothetical protein